MQEPDTLEEIEWLGKVLAGFETKALAVGREKRHVALHSLHTLCPDSSCIVRCPLSARRRFQRELPDLPYQTKGERTNPRYSLVPKCLRKCRQPDLRHPAC